MGKWYAVQPDHAHGWWVVSRDTEGDDCIDASGDGGFNEDVARLISAAPDMLEALHLALGTINGAINVYGAMPAWTYAAKEVSAAIAKATGEKNG